MYNQNLRKEQVFMISDTYNLQMFCNIRKELNRLGSYAHAYLNDFTLLSFKALQMKVKPCSGYVCVCLCCVCVFMLLMIESRIYSYIQMFQKWANNVNAFKNENNLNFLFKSYFFMFQIKNVLACFLKIIIVGLEKEVTSQCLISIAVCLH